MAVLEMEEGRMQVCRDGAPIYDIVLEDSFDRLPEEMERLGSQGRKLCIVTDSNVLPCIWRRWKSSFPDASAR